VGFSYENELLLLLFNFGAVGTTLAVAAFYVAYYVHARSISKGRKVIFHLLPVDMMLCSLSMDCQSTWYAFPLITFIVLYCLRSEAQPDGPSQGTLSRKARPLRMLPAPDTAMRKSPNCSASQKCG
jgi:hypothetical protein